MFGGRIWSVRLPAYLPATRSSEGRSIAWLTALRRLTLPERRPRRVQRQVRRVDAGVDEVAAVAALADAVLAREVVVRRRRQPGLVVVDLAGTHLEQALVDVGVGRDHDPVGIRRPVAPVEAVPLEHDLAAHRAAGDPIRAGRRVDADPLAVDRHARLHGREERHRDLGEEGRVRADEPDRQRLAVRADAADGAGPARVAGVRADDVVHERDRGRALLAGSPRARRRA